MKETSDTDPDGPLSASDSTADTVPNADPGLTAPSGEVDPELMKRIMAGLGARTRRDPPPNLRIEPVIRAETKGDLAAAYHAGPRAAPMSRDTQPGFEAAVIPPPDARHEPTLRLPHAPGKSGGPLSDEPASAYESEAPRLPVRSPRLAWVALAVLIFGAVGVLLLNRRASNEGAAAPASASISSPPPRPSVAAAREPAAAPIAPVSSPTLIAPPEASAVHSPALRKIEPERLAPKHAPLPPPKPPIPSADTTKPPPENELIK